MNILVIGAGPSGLMAGCELARQGVCVRLVDRKPEAVVESRALGIQARTLEIFDTLGFAERFVEEGLQVEAVRLYSQEELLFRLDFTSLPSRFNFMLMLPQSQTERLLAEQAERHGVKVERGVEVVALHPNQEAVEVEFASGEHASYDYVVGCDGAHSIVRHALDVPFEGQQYRETFLLADIAITWPEARTEACVFMGKHGFMGVFPLPSGLWRIVSDVSHVPEERLSSPPTLGEVHDAFHARCALPARLGDLEWSSHYHVHRRIVEHVRLGRCFLVGDAAHIHSPAGGQGMNIGLHDAHNLAWKLALVARQLARPSLLGSYESERLPVDRFVLNESHLLTRNAELKNPVLLWLRDKVLPMVMSAEAARRYVRSVISELVVDYKDSPIVFDEGGEGPEPGSWWGGKAPQRLAFRVLGSRACQAHGALPEALHEIVEAEDDPQIKDLVVIRPDGYVGFRTQNPAGIAPYFARTGITGKA